MWGWVKNPMFRRNRRSVAVDEGAIVYRDRNGAACLPWNDLVRVAIETTDEGPFVGDFFWILEGDGTVLRIASSDAGAEDLLIALQDLPGFDNDAVIDASLTIANATFECWARRR